MTFKFVVFEVY